MQKKAKNILRAVRHSFLSDTRKPGIPAKTSHVWETLTANEEGAFRDAILL